MATQHIIQGRDLIDMLMRHDVGAKVIIDVDGTHCIVDKASTANGMTVIHAFGDLNGRLCRLEADNERLVLENNNLSSKVAELTNKLTEIKEAITPVLQIANG